MNLLKKSILTVGLILALSSQAFASEVKQPTLSPWAVKPINNAQMQGIYPISPEQQTKNYTVEVSKSDIDSLNKALESKLELTKLKINNKTFKPVSVKNDNTREDVLTNIYNIVGPYADNSGKGVVEYFKENKLINGNGTDLSLDKKATLEQTITFYNRAITDVINDQNMGGKGVFYKVQANGNTVYMFGSIHAGNDSMYPVDSDVMDAFESSDELFVEADITNAEQIVKSQKKLISDTPLSEQLGADLYNRYKAVMDKYGVPEESYKNLKLWSAYNTLSSIPMATEMPYGTAFGVDQYFLINANLDQKQIKELESIDFQFDMLEKFGTEKYLALTKELLTQIEKDNGKTIIQELKNMQQYWRNGDENAFDKIFSSQDEFTKYLVVDRDPEMAKKIDGLLKSKDKKTYFVVVGSGHYAPKNSVINYLKNMGYTVENLTGK